MFQLILSGLMVWAANQDPDDWRLAGGEFNWAKLDFTGAVLNRYATRADMRRNMGKSYPNPIPAPPPMQLPMPPTLKKR